jgi:hypothetical protein
VANYKNSTNTNTSSNNTRQDENTQKQRKSNKLRLSIFKPDFRIISVDIQTLFAAETHRAKEPWLEEQMNMLKLLIFRVVS